MKKLFQFVVLCLIYIAQTQTSYSQAMLGEDSTMVRNVIRSVHAETLHSEGHTYLHTGKVLVFGIYDHATKSDQVLMYHLNDKGKVIKYVLRAGNSYLPIVYDTFRKDYSVKEIDDKFYDGNTIWSIRRMRQTPSFELIAEAQ